MIHLGSVVHSGMLSQMITIERSSGTWENGVYTKGEPETITTRGIVTVASPRQLNEVKEGDRQSGGIRILTTERVYVTGESSESGYSDVIVWHGERYKLQSVTPDNDYGFYRAIGTRIRKGG